MPRASTSGSVDELLHRQQLDRGHAEVAQVVDHRRRGQPGVRAAQVLGHPVVQRGHALDVQLVDDGVAPARRSGRRSSPQSKSVVHHHAAAGRTARSRGGRACSGAPTSKPKIAGSSARLAADRPRVGVEQQLVRVEPQPELGLPRPVGPEAVAGARRDAGDRAVPDAERALGQLVPGLARPRRRTGRPTPASPRAPRPRSWSPPRPRSTRAARCAPARRRRVSPGGSTFPGSPATLCRTLGTMPGAAPRLRWSSGRGRRADRDHDIDEDETPMAEFVRLEVTDGVGTIRLDRPKMNALNVQVQEEIRAAAAEATARDDVKAVVVYGGERVFAAGADIKEMAEMSYVDMVQRSGAAPVGVHRGGPDPQAGRRRDHRLRPRRRLRAGAVRRRPLRRRGRRARPARDPARHHPRRRRHPAADPAGRPEPGQGHHLHRPLRQGRRGAGHRAGRPRRARPTRCTPRRVAWAGQFAGAATYAAPRGEGVDRPRPRGRPRHRAGHRAAAVRGPVRHRGPRHRHDVVRRERARARPSSRAAEWPNAVREVGSLCHRAGVAGRSDDDAHDGSRHRWLDNTRQRRRGRAATRGRRTKRDRPLRQGRGRPSSARGWPRSSGWSAWSPRCSWPLGALLHRAGGQPATTRS